MTNDSAFHTLRTVEPSQEPVSIPLQEPAPQTLRSLRWVMHLLILAAYPLALRALAEVLPLPKQDGQTTLIPSDPAILLQTLSIQLGLFLVIFALAWAISQASIEQLMLPWRDGWGPLWRGFLYSIGLRVFILVVVLTLALIALLAFGADAEKLRQLRPQTEQLVDPKTLAANPLFLFLNVTVVSFVFAGFREELWRAGMLAAIFALFPRLNQGWGGKAVAVTMVAILFGLGHLPQGWGGVGITGVLGLGLGAIMVFHRSIWPAVFAHGFFDATTFLVLYAIAPYWEKLIKGS